MHTAPLSVAHFAHPDLVLAMSLTMMAFRACISWPAADMSSLSITVPGACSPYLLEHVPPRLALPRVVGLRRCACEVARCPCAGNDLARCLNWGGSMGSYASHSARDMLRAVNQSTVALLDRWNVSIAPTARPQPSCRCLSCWP